jgi:hypothetical protein
MTQSYPSRSYSTLRMDAALSHLLMSEVTSFARWDVLRFFLETEQRPTTIDQLSLALERDISSLLAILGELTTLGWLARRSDPVLGTIYTLTQERERRLLLDKFHAAMHDSTFRLQVITYWSRATRRAGER